MIGTPADRRRSAQIDAELLGDLALHFGDAHFQHHLFARVDLEHVDDLGRIAREARRQILARVESAALATVPVSTILSFSAAT